MNSLQSRCNLFKKSLRFLFDPLTVSSRCSQNLFTIYFSDLFEISVRSFLRYFCYLRFTIFLRSLHILFTISLVDLFTNSLRSLSDPFLISFQFLYNLLNISYVISLRNLYDLFSITLRSLRSLRSPYNHLTNSSQIYNLRALYVPFTEFLPSVNYRFTMSLQSSLQLLYDLFKITLGLSLRSPLVTFFLQFF